MAELLNDVEIRRILGTVIKDGVETSVRSSDWEDAVTKEDPAALLDRVIESGFPWNALGTKLKAIDNQFQEVSNEYANIHDSIERLEGEIGGISKEVEEIRSSQGGLTDRIRQVVREELPAMQDRWLIATGSLVIALVGIVITVINSKVARDLLAQHGVWFGPVLVVSAMGVFWWARRRRKQEDE